MTDSFIPRHIGPGEQDIADMLAAVGAASLDDLTARVVPANILDADPADIGDGMGEHEALEKLSAMARHNKIFRSLIGMGYYDTVTPPVILRNVLQNPGWYTAYTPYQPEISQGRLEALINFQQMIMDMTGMPLANASLLDEATAAAEAMTLARRMNTANDSDAFLVSADCHPQVISVLETRAAPLGIRIVTGRAEDLPRQNGFGILLAYPATTGEIGDLPRIAAAARAKNMTVAVATDLMALALLQPPGAWGADIVFGSSQRFGVPLGYGGPHAAFFAARDDYKRMLPGRIVGVSHDSAGRPAYRLALQTREQHIRREKATSNICTAQVLLANIAGFYAVWHGAEGIRAIAARIHGLTSALAAGLARLGFTIENRHAFDTLTVDGGGRAQEILARAQGRGFNFRDFGDGRVGLSLDEKSTADEIFTLWQIFAGQSVLPFAYHDMAGAPSLLPPALARTQPFLTHPTFSRHRSETAMLRYLRHLEHKDIALNRSMIPLGSCTMKLNATAEMIPISWPEFADIHPYAPASQTEGYRLMLRDLEDKLAALTGFAAVSLQPNAGSQGEYAGLLAIRGYHLAHGHAARNLCLIPASAHGTNPASAVMAGMDVLVVACDARGNIDLADLKKKAEENRERLAALMVTYPSTHGVFEEEIREICRIIHDNGGQVYMDGANFNAMVGVARPGSFGADVMHLNLHKTFCIPHGGGGPGMGPIGVAAHLAPYLPGDPLDGGSGAVSAAAYGSASILPISWVYIALMGAAGLKRATQVAILSANYIAKQLAGDYPTLYAGKDGFVAHECILDTRPLKSTANVSVDDIAKRLMDFGFHAPTMSFPVAGTLMIEPTESEPKEELDRFIAAMKMIRAEIARVEKGEWPQGQNPLHLAPHTLADVTADDWTRPYPRQTAAFALPFVAADKYWPPVGRIDHAAGDRNLVCACPPLDAYGEAA